MKLLDYIKVQSIEEAYDLLQSNNNAAIIAGGAWSRLLGNTVDLGIDLDQLDLDTIEVEDHIKIGAMTTLHQIESSKVLKEFANGILVQSAKCIMGVPIRNIATIGGSICGRYGFSDLITPLLALDAQLEFYKGGIISLEAFLEEKTKDKDILLNVLLPLDVDKGFFEAFKKTSIDFSVVNVSVVLKGEKVNIVVGARPGVGKKIMIDKEKLEKDTGTHVIEQLNFGANTRSSKEYRQEVAKALIHKGILEVTK